MYFKLCSYSSGSKSDLKKTRNGCPTKPDCTPICRSGIEGELEISEGKDSEVERTELVGELLWNAKQLIRTGETVHQAHSGHLQMTDFLMID